MAQKQVHWEDVQEAMELPAWTKQPANVQLFLYSAITRNAHRIHYDKEYAATEGYPEVVIHGPLQGALLASYVTNWIGDKGFLKKLSYQNRTYAVVGDSLTFKGRVKRKWVEDRQHLVELELWEENQRGEVCMPGAAVVALPSRGAARAR